MAPRSCEWAIASINDDAWTPTHYPHAVWDEQAGQLFSEAEITEVPFTAFSSRRKNEHITAQLLVRRVKRLNPTPSTSSSAGADGAAHDSGEQGELIAAYRYDAVFTDNPLRLVQAEKVHRGHAITEQVHADWCSGPLTHLPSGSFAASAPNTRTPEHPTPEHPNTRTPEHPNTRTP